MFLYESKGLRSAQGAELAEVSAQTPLHLAGLTLHAACSPASQFLLTGLNGVRAMIRENPYVSKIDSHPKKHNANENHRNA